MDWSGGIGRVTSVAPCEWSLVIAGDGPQRRELQALARSSRLNVPSRRDMIPGAMLELQSYGIPTLAPPIFITR